MSLKFKIAKLEDAEEAHRSLYNKGEDGAYYLGVEGAVGKDKLDEFRNKNIELMKGLEKFKDVDPQKYAELLAEHQKISDKKLIEEGKVEEVIAQRVQAMKAEHDKMVAKLSADLKVSNRQLESLIVDNAVRAEAVKLGIAPTAVDDVLLRAKTVYSVENGKAVPKDQEGRVIFGSDGTNPLSIKDWIGGLKDSAPHLFQPSNGSGSSNNGRGNGKADWRHLAPAQKIAAGLRNGIETGDES